jgi:hypothetical protein
MIEEASEATIDEVSTLFLLCFQLIVLALFLKAVETRLLRTDAGEEAIDYHEYWYTFA